MVEEDSEIIDEIILTRDITVLFEPLTTIVEIEDDLKNDVFLVMDERLYDLEKMNNQMEYQSCIFDNMKAAIGSGKPIILISYYPLVALSLKVLGGLLEKNNGRYKMKFVAFFHDDEQTEDLEHLEGIDDMLELKDLIIESMEEFPFIKKATIPVGLNIDREYLNKITGD